MKFRICTLLIFAAVCAAGQTDASKTAAAKKAASKKAPQKKAQSAKAPAPVTIPAGAVESEPGIFRYTDPQGKRWVYQRTPFGISRTADVQESQTARDKEQKTEAASMKAFDDGDYVRFERTTPFGPFKWRKKKTELNEVETQVWNRTRQGDAAREAGKE